MSGKASAREPTPAVAAAPAAQTLTAPAARPRAQAPLAAVIQRARLSPRALTREDVTQLHRALGNAAVGRLLAGAAAPNRTGLPEGLKAGVEALSGLAMDDVQVHRDSPEPARLGAHAYARGTEIHLAPGQERHLPHEAWHVVQQMQGRVAPRLCVAGVAVDDDEALEREANDMGRAATAGSVSTDSDIPQIVPSLHPVAQRVRNRARRQASGAPERRRELVADVRPDGPTGLVVKVIGMLAGAALGYILYRLLKPQIDAVVSPEVGPYVMPLLGAALGAALSSFLVGTDAEPMPSEDSRTANPSVRSASGVGDGSSARRPPSDLGRRFAPSEEGGSSSSGSKSETMLPRMFLSDDDPSVSVKVSIDESFGASGKHHPTLTFRIEGLDPRTFNYESWTKFKMSDSVKLDMSAEDRQYAKTIVEDWKNKKESIIELLYDALIEKDQENRIDAKRFRSGTINMTLLILSSLEDVRRRVNDIGKKCPVPKIMNDDESLSDIDVDWFAILKQGREQIKHLALRKPCPLKDDIREIHQATREYDGGRLARYMTDDNIFDSSIVINAEKKGETPG